MMRRILIALHGFLAITAIGGGLGLLMGTGAPPLEMLAGSPFTSYVIPGLALLVVVGGLASSAALLLRRRHGAARRVSFLTAGAIVVFEAVEVWTIGSPEGAARTLQLIYVVTGAAIALLTLSLPQKETAA